MSNEIVSVDVGEAVTQSLKDYIFDLIHEECMTKYNSNLITDKIVDRVNAIYQGDKK